jgi:SAM-dependent methyltransferase
MGAPDILPAAATEGFKDASAYDAYRPSYPSEAVESFLKHLKIAGQANLNVIEIAAGTGKFTELLSARHENFDIVAVEPHAGMRNQLVDKNLRNVQALDGHAAKLPVTDMWGDACIAAQAFHWYGCSVSSTGNHVLIQPPRFATEETLREVHRALKPKAVFGMIWNIEDCKLKPSAIQ